MIIMDSNRPKNVTLRCVLDLVILSTLSILLVLFVSGTFSPRYEGFFCDDTSIAYSVPGKEQFPTIWLFPLVIISSLIVFTLFESYEYYCLKGKSGTQQPPLYVVCSLKVHPLLAKIYYHAETFFLGLLITVLTGEAIKSQVGSLRPIFLAVCKPDMNITRCFDEVGLPRLVIEDVCQESDKGLLNDLRKSFPSNHAVTTSYLFVFLSLYVHVKMTCRQILAVRYLIQASFVYCAIYISLTRVADHYHHLHDVIAGMVIGTIGAVLVAFQSLPFQDPNFQQFVGAIKKTKGISTTTACMKKSGRPKTRLDISESSGLLMHESI